VATDVVVVVPGTVNVFVLVVPVIDVIVLARFTPKKLDAKSPPVTLFLW